MSIPIRIQPFFLVLIFLIGWLNAPSIGMMFVWAGIIFISVLVHEFGHALTAVAFGQKAQIELYGMGGVTQRQGPQLKLWQDFLIVLNGPLAGLFLAFLAKTVLGFVGDNSVLTYPFVVTFYVNLIWTIVNLIPVHPLDGGHLLRIFLESIFGFRGVKASFLFGVVLGFFLSIFSVMTNEIFLAVLFSFLTFESFKGWQSVRAMTGQDRNVLLQTLFKQGQVAMDSGNFDLAYTLFDEVRAKAQKGLIYQASIEMMGQILYEKEHFIEAFRLLEPKSLRLSHEGLRLLHEVAFKSGKWEETIKFGNQAYQHFPNYETALLNAMAHGVLGHAEESMGWLKTSIDEGLPNVEEVLSKKEFDHVRHLYRP